MALRIPCPRCATLVCRACLTAHEDAGCRPASPVRVGPKIAPAKVDRI